MPKNPKKHRSNPFLQVKTEPERSKSLILAIGGDDWSESVDEGAQSALDARGYAPITLADIAPAGSSWLETLVLALSMLASVDGVMLLSGWPDSTLAHEIVMAAGHEGVPVFYADELARVNAS